MSSRSLRRLIFAFVLLFFCAQSEGAGCPPRYRLSVTDHPDHRRFVLALHSLDKRPLCLYCNDWPDKRGKIWSPWVTLQSSEGMFKARIAGCRLLGPENVIRIPPGGTITALIGYEQFGAADRMATLHHRKLRIEENLRTVVPCPAESHGCPE